MQPGRTDLNPGSTGVDACDFTSLGLSTLLCERREMNPSFLEVMVRIRCEGAP